MNSARHHIADDHLFESGVYDGITDVKGVSVGHVSISDGDAQTGVTVVLPSEKDAENALLFYGKYSDGENTELTGFQVTEDFGLLSAPIFFTNLLSVGRIYNGALTYAFSRGRGLPTEGGWPPIIMGFDDRSLNEMPRRVLNEEHALEALENAGPGPVSEGTVGAGVGAVSFGFKGGIGSASRIVNIATKSYTVGSLVLANYGQRTDLTGAPEDGSVENPYPSFLGVIATDAPLTSPMLDSLASNAARGAEYIGGLHRPAGSYTVVAFSTGHLLRGPEEDARYQLHFEEVQVIRALEDAARESAHAAVIKALSVSESATGSNGTTVSAMPQSLVRTLK